MTRLTILHTNDLHARITQLVRIAALAKTIRRDVEAAGGHCVLWDAGDAEDTTLVESSMTKGNAVMAMLRGAGYELEALGNASPLRYGPQCIAALAEQFGRPLLCANFIDPRTQQLAAGLSPYAILNFGDLKVGVIGLTDPLPAYRIFKLITPAPADILPGLIDEVRGRGAQTIILLSHLGSPKDRAVAEAISGIDVIIGAHDHQEIYPPLNVNGTLIVQAGYFGRHLGRLDLEIDPTTGRIIQHRGELLPITDEMPIDAEAQAAVEAERERVRQITAHVIGHAHQSIEVAYDRECVAGRLLADALRDRMQVEIALALSGQWTTPLEAGPITIGNLFTACRSTANPGVVSLTGEQIVSFLQAAIQPENSARTPRGQRGVPIGWPNVAGLRVVYNPASHQIIEVYASEVLLEPDRLYRVASTDMELTDYSGYLKLSDDQIEYEVPTISAEVLQDYIEARGSIGASDQRFFRRDE
ncbi:MAG: bifunctional UDP-sugar hydrolase/5'-nucleotidase [Anaerolineae bacterium]